MNSLFQQLSIRNVLFVVLLVLNFAVFLFIALLLLTKYGFLTALGQELIIDASEGFLLFVARNLEGSLGAVTMLIAFLLGLILLVRGSLRKEYKKSNLMLASCLFLLSVLTFTARYLIQPTACGCLCP